jgi:hypothetical protein
MQELLDLKHIAKLRLQFQNKIKNSLLTSFNLDYTTRHNIENIDFNESSFSPDLYYLYFKSFINKNWAINAPTPALFIKNHTPIVISSIAPKESLADNYLIKHELGAELFALKAPSESELDKTKSNFIQAISILSLTKASCIDENLLNSIAIYNGSQESASSASILICQGRIYVRNVGNDFPLFYYVDTLVHEIAHQNFNIIQNLTNLIADYEQTFLSCLKNKQRPINGILHGAFVLFRLIDFYSKNAALLEDLSLPYGNQDYSSYLYSRFFKIPYNYDFRLKIYKQKLQNTLEELKDSSALTAKGHEFIKYIRALA